MNLEELSEDIQQICLDEIGFVKEALSNRESVDIDTTLKLADALRKWSMLWVDIEKRKPKKAELPDDLDLYVIQDCEREWVKTQPF